MGWTGTCHLHLVSSEELGMSSSSPSVGGAPIAAILSAAMANDMHALNALLQAAALASHDREVACAVHGTLVKLADVLQEQLDDGQLGDVVGDPIIAANHDLRTQLLNVAGTSAGRTPVMMVDAVAADDRPTYHREMDRLVGLADVIMAELLPED